MIGLLVGALVGGAAYAWRRRHKGTQTSAVITGAIAGGAGVVATAVVSMLFWPLVLLGVAWGGYQLYEGSQNKALPPGRD